MDVSQKGWMFHRCHTDMTDEVHVLIHVHSLPHLPSVYRVAHKFIESDRKENINLGLDDFEEV